MKRSSKDKDQPKPRTEILDQAARHLRGNKLEPALKLYEQLYEQEPDDWTVANSLGDLYVRLSKHDEAIAVFMSLAEHMAEQGHAVKARALYRKVLRMRPGDAAATSRVAELENEHLDASPFMQRVRGVLLDAQAAVAAAPDAEADEAPAPPVDAPLRVSTFQQSAPPMQGFGPPPEPEPAYEPEPVFVPPPPPEPPAIAFAPPPSHAAAFSPEEMPEVEMDLGGAPQAPSYAGMDVDLASPPVIQADPLPAGFSPSPDDWIPMGRMLAAARVYDRPTEAVSATRLAAFDRMESSARRVAAGGDYRGARQIVEQFLLGFQEDVDALQMLVELSVDARFEDVVATQIRLADACLATGRTHSGRHVALDLLHRYHADPAVAELAERVLSAARSMPAAARVAAPAAVASAVALVDEELVDEDVSDEDVIDQDVADEDVVDQDVELFDDEGLVTADRAAEEAAARAADPLEDWLDAAEESEARTALSAASRMAAAGDFPGAIAALESLMPTPALRPVAGVGLAQLYRHEGNFPRALQCLEQALEQPPVDADNAHALAYELALTLEEMGQRHEALGLYRELLSEVGPAFRDVAARAEQLSAA